MPTPARHSRTPSGGRRRTAGRVRTVALLTLGVVVAAVSGSSALESRTTATAAQQEALSVSTSAPAAPSTTAPTTPATAAEPAPGTAGTWDATPPTDVEPGGAGTGPVDPTAPDSSSAGASGSGAGSASAPGAPSGPGSWLSGASGPDAASGAFARWRGSALGIMGTWSDNNDAMVNMWQLQPGGDLLGWSGPLDIAIGAIGPGETWSQAASGAYDARWTQSLQQLKTLRAGSTGPTFIRFAHEMNSNWYAWSVDSSEKADFVAAWQRFRALQQSIFPASQLVFCLNRESVGTGFDWRQSWPGDDQVDVLGVDYYNQWPYAASTADFTAALNQTDQYGAPKGLGAYQQFARAHGVPLAVPEWSGKADNGDSPGYIQGMHDWFAANAGSGPGQLRYEILFDVDGADYHGNYVLSSGTRMPQSAEAYRRLF